MFLFVYGTLLSGKEGHFLLKGASLVAKGYVQGTLYDLGVGFPALGIDEVRGRVYGEVYEVDERTINILDKYEGYIPDRETQSVYLRKEILFFSEKGKAFPVQAYIMPPERRKQFLATIISSGRWN